MTAIKVSISSLEDSDIPEIMEIERNVFVSHWPESAFMNELEKNRLAHYYTAHHEGILVGYAGIWLVIDEAHITTLAVHPHYRGKRIAEQLLQHLLIIAIAKGARWATLEVRESNQAARGLYKKYGFNEVGLRKNYYQEEGENAVIMSTGNLRSEAFHQKLTDLQKAFGFEQSAFSAQQSAVSGQQSAF